MMTITQKRISTYMTPELVKLFQKNMQARFNPLIASMKREYWNRISLPSGEVENWLIDELTSAGSPEVIGDLIMVDPETLFYYKLEKGQSHVEVGIISKGDSRSLASFCSQVSEILRGCDIKVTSDWYDVEYGSEVRQSIKDSSMTLEPSTQEIQASRFLEEELARRFLERIKGTEATSLYKLVDPKDLPKIGPIVDKLEKMGLLTKDFVVICSKTGQPILKVSSRSAIEETSTDANKCFICGNPLSKETIDEIVSCSDFGKKLVEGDYWFPVRLLSALESYGIPLREVGVQTAENGLINLFLVLNGQSYLFVLINRKLTLDDAYFISAYISAFTINHALIISTDKISSIMKRHMEDSNRDTTVSFVDYMKNFDNTIMYFLMEREKAYLEKVLEPFTPLTPISIQTLILRRVARENPALFVEEKPVQKPAAPPAPAAHIPEKPQASQAQAPAAVPHESLHLHAEAHAPVSAPQSIPSAPPVQQAPPQAPPAQTVSAAHPPQPPVPQQPPAVQPAAPPQQNAAPPEQPPAPQVQTITNLDFELGEDDGAPLFMEEVLPTDEFSSN
jgi:hypothetical protein